MNRVDFIKSLLRDAISIPKEKQAVFFKTAPGDYAEHEQFIGVPVPMIRQIAKNHLDLRHDELKEFIDSPINEERFLALIILVSQYQKSNVFIKEACYQFYLENINQVNNWNLVDASAHLIIGAYLWDKDKNLLFTLAHSESLWKRRIAIVSTWYFIRKESFDWTYTLSALLFNDSQDLIHKAVGWMLREAGKKDEKRLLDFLHVNAKKMPRTMLRYAIERLEENDRKVFLCK